MPNLAAHVALAAVGYTAAASVNDALNIDAIYKTA